MGRRGPAPAPSWLELVKGNPGKRKLNINEPQPKKITWQEPPEYFNDDLRKVWFQVCKELNELGILATCDKFLMERYCVFLQKWRECRIFISERLGGRFSYPVKSPAVPELRNAAGHIIRAAIPSEIKYFKPFPEVRMLQELSSHLIHIEDRFGLSPSARSRITTSDQSIITAGNPEEYDDFADLND